MRLMTWTVTYDSYFESPIHDYGIGVTYMDCSLWPADPCSDNPDYVLWEQAGRLPGAYDIGWGVSEWDKRSSIRGTELGSETLTQVYWDPEEYAGRSVTPRPPDLWWTPSRLKPSSPPSTTRPTTSGETDGAARWFTPLPIG